VDQVADMANVKVAARKQACMCLDTHWLVCVGAGFREHISVVEALVSAGLEKKH
jgi:hypothetical protein